ncbi:hypothetical protein IFM89_039793 [Coptis chinensis]|uniref:RNase H type-1 domain-containing protein n=1 Tax=Coptis chinensis TaxID=261450 RepID=A0A835GSN6_9MAGN|nr:hypothetical protein IFM89_039793 [Coptis chinensis]
MEGLKAARMIGNDQIEINSDSKRAINILNGKELTPWLCFNVTKTIRQQIRKFQKVEVGVRLTAESIRIKIELRHEIGSM